MTDVRCTIANCEYWGEGNVCVAGEILVAAGPPESQPSGQSALAHTPVPSDLDTHCHTFEAEA